MATKDLKYTVVKVSGKQYLVSSGEEVLVDKITSDKPNVETLLYVDGDKVEIGKPVLEKRKIAVKILEPEVKGEKIRVFKYKAKSRYRKTKGFRPRYTKLLVEKIS